MKSRRSTTRCTARRQDFENKTWLARQLGTAFTGGEYVHAVRTMQRITRPSHDFLERYDVLLTPNAVMGSDPITAFSIFR
ncbi:MAG: hypothetical protein ABI333_00220 [bacterium]